MNTQGTGPTRADVAVRLHSDPEVDGYRVALSVRFGEPLTIPAPVDIVLDTEALKDYVR
ncbi:hypothetical protein ACFQLX_02450 [Streptomyces polyrhachis]|uniref:Uncharacterized protein n=1 Tax=Streptomyces polyrhachis TaxID=1282885 RepID=A0ABW2GB90_9ACTN